MTEVSFAKSFLTTLDSRPPKLSPDHVEDAKNYPARPPYILPKMPRAMTPKRQERLAPGQERSVTVHVRSLRNPPLDVRLTSQPLTTSVLDVKAAVAARAGLAGTIKVLHRKKPVADSKVLRDLVGDSDDDTIELSVMIMGGGGGGGGGAGKTTTTTTGEHEEPAAPVADPAQGPIGEAVLESDAFWTDLRGFLLQRIRDEKVTEELFGKFLSSWDSSR